MRNFCMRELKFCMKLKVKCVFTFVMFMQKIFKTILFLSAFALLSFKDFGISYKLTDHDLRGKVKSIRQSLICSNEALKHKTCFNDEWHAYFNEAGNVIKDTSFGMHSITSFFSYSMKRDTLEYNYTSGDTAYYKTLYLYLGNGNLAEEIDFKRVGPDFKKIGSSKYFYYKRTVEEYRYGITALLSTDTYTYNNDGKLVKEKAVDVHGKVILERNNTYDNSGNLVKNISWLGSPKSIDTVMYEYNERNDVILQSYSYKGKPFHDVFKYEYDNVGNWVLKTTFVSDTLWHTITRQIEYY